MKDCAVEKLNADGVARQVEEAVDRLSAEARKLKQFSELIALQTSSPKVFIDGETMRALADSSEIDVR